MGTSSLSSFKVISFPPTPSPDYLKMSYEDEKKENIGFTTVEPVVSAGKNELHIRSGAGE